MITTESSEALPKSIRILELVNSRYSDNVRPDSWDSRKSGIDLVLADDGMQYRLFSDGQQSPPQAGWTLILREILSDPDAEETAQKTYSWTLYGI